MKKEKFSIVYEDEFILGVNKASGVAVGGDRWDDAKERLDRLLRETHGNLFTVHRIDCATSGLVVFAKDADAHRRLCHAFENRLVKKRYLAVVQGRPVWRETSCDLPLVLDGDKQHRTIIDRYQGKKSLTRFRLLGTAGNYALLEALPETGRTHQIRAHLAALGHPVVCDPLYGTLKPVMLSSFKRGWRGDPLEERPLIARLGLHAAELLFPDRTLTAPTPRDIAAFIKQMEKLADRTASSVSGPVQGADSM
ncbi:MAG: RluA family pseudouridine synthase [Spirochaetaceae bacterium]|jgi:23S rRNA pseudouridine1911/1915/1917 synthase|nr:RluA family pseudouridine synthase [Spirochaetaceae bacterium]